MAEVNNPHDRLMRETFQDKAEAISFFKDTLPSEVLKLLELSNLELSESSFVSEELKAEQTDLLFKIPLKSGHQANVYLLFEHKSYLAPGIYIQLLGYLAEIYRNQHRNGGTLCVVIPFVFYHGEKEWRLGARFLNQFTLSFEELMHLKVFIPDFRIELFDLSGVEVEEKLESITLQVIFGVVQRIHEGEKVFERVLLGLFSLLIDITDEAKRVAILNKLLLYIYSVRDSKPSALKDLLHLSNLKRYEELAMTTAEKLIQEGKIEGKIEDARKMLAKGIDLKTILEITELTEKDLRAHGIIE
ncbi:Rpn family recombination-promoting nuclease/putative transposase [Leptospira alstonii]|uniref:Rpn family recombination-promoting nuclease/putative transposase n=1 Tax=Leptospira alstonii TaxID=28452 RepID=UPI0007742E66|nr:Rpn family recombination-promoting nuclease/putative transposase [Leptospira alstonii]